MRLHFRKRTPRPQGPGSRALLPAACAALLLGWPAEPLAAEDSLKTYQSPYYVIHTDLDIDAAREAAVRTMAMAEEYHRRTRGFSGVIRSKLPFYLYRRAEDYHRAGGPAGSVGAFTGGRLMALAGERPGKRTWHTLQHEGFHQFAYAVIGGHIPIWVNEGLAEYFGEAVFTGDGFVAGLVPPARLARLKEAIRTGKLRDFAEMMSMSRSEWAREIEIADYDLAWSMIHFLVHGDDGRYVRPLSGFINDVGRGTRYEQAWLKHFGRDIDAFHARWRSYWLDQPADPTRTGRLQAVAATLTSFLARATSRRQRFADFADFFQAGRAGRLQARPQDWLPPGLLAEALDQAEARGAWSLEQPPRAMPRLCCRSEDGAELTGWFALRDGRVARVAVEVRHEPAPASTATAPGKDRR